MRLLVELVHTFKMFARSLPRMFRQHFVAAPLTPRSTFSKFSSVIKTNVHRQKSGLFSTLSHFDSKPQTCPQMFRAFSLSQGSSRTSPAAFSTRSFFSSSDGPRPAFSEVISILKLKVGSSSVLSEMHHSLMLQTAACTLWYLVRWWHRCARNRQRGPSGHEKVNLFFSWRYRMSSCNSHCSLS
jgi:hypothetical protein